MTGTDARHVALIMTIADGGCPSCVVKLLEEFARVFPMHAETIEAVTTEFERRGHKLWEEHEPIDDDDPPRGYIEEGRQ